MAFPVLDTPRTELGDQTRLTGAADLEFSTENSIPSPSKEGHDLLKQIRGMRIADNGTPRSRLPLTERRAMPNKNEFTPLLKSATRNRVSQPNGILNKENRYLKTPQALKNSYRSNSPALPLNSSVILEENTESSAPDGGDSEAPIPNVSSSSALSTPMVALPRRGEGPLDQGGNLATLREQEARLEQIDKENFGLKLKIHFLEEAMRKNGREFNEAAVKENTELKVDKVTLQRDLKHYRKQLTQAERDLEEYKRQLLDYAEKVKRRHANEGLLEELDQLRENVTKKEKEIEDLRNSRDSADKKSAEIEKLSDDISNLEADLKDRDRQIEEKDDELEDLRGRISNEDEVAQLQSDLEACEDELEKVRERKPEEDEVAQLRSDLDERDDEIQGLQDALRRSGEDTKRQLAEKDRRLEEKEDELNEMEEQLKGAGHDQSFAVRSKDQEIRQYQQEIALLKQKVEKADIQLEEAATQKEQLRAAETNLSTEIRSKARVIEEKDFEIHTLQQKLEVSDDRDEQVENLQDRVRDLEADVRESQRLVDEKEDAMEEVREKLHHLENESDEELMAAQDRIHELETQQSRHLNELQQLRDEGSKASHSRSHKLEAAQAQIAELEHAEEMSRESQRHLQKDLRGLRSQITELERDIYSQKERFESDEEEWQRQRLAFQTANSKAEDKVKSLERSIAHLKEAEGNLSSKEVQLQRALDSEKQRYEEEQAALQQDLDEANDAREEHQVALRETNSQLKQARLEIESRGKQSSELREQIQALEDEIEVLQSATYHESKNDTRTKEDLLASRQEADSLRRQLRGLQQDLAKSQVSHEAVQSQLESLKETISHRSPQTSPSTTRNLESRIQDLTTQLSQSKSSRDSLAARLQHSEAAQKQARADNDTLHLDLETHTSSTSHLHQQLQKAQADLARAQKETRTLQTDLRNTEAEAGSLQATVAELENAQTALHRTIRDQKIQQREHERKAAAQVADYERDIVNLEQDLADSETQRQTLAKKVESGEAHVARLKLRLAATRGRSPGGVGVKEQERRDLHNMLRDAKVGAEDLAAQLKASEARVEAAGKREAELRRQLASFREEPRRMEDTLALPLGEKSPAQKEAEKRHALELKGLVRQIEYLSAKCRREEAFRADLSYAKAWFLRVLEMHARCNRLDLGLVGDMGVPVSAIFKDEVGKAGGRDVTGCWVGVREGGIVGADARAARKIKAITRRERPLTLRAVGNMVLAAVRMRRAAESWKRVKARHDAVLRKLGSIRKDRLLPLRSREVGLPAEGRGKVLGKRK